MAVGGNKGLHIRTIISVVNFVTQDGLETRDMLRAQRGSNRRQVPVERQGHNGGGVHRSENGDGV